MNTVKHRLFEVPLEEMPRERFRRIGEKGLADYELLAILLRSGYKNRHVLNMARDLINQFGDLYALKMASLDELAEIKGVGNVKAIELKAAIELGTRIVNANQQKHGVIRSSKIAGEIIRAELKDAYQEQLLALFLNTKNELIKKQIIFKGSLNSSIAHPREIFREAVRISSAQLIIGHNHPSGNLEPSQADLQFTKRMVECGELMGITLLDHLIVGEQGYISLKESGHL